MAKCLRCGAGSEWIQGKVKSEPCDGNQGDGDYAVLSDAPRLIINRFWSMPNSNTFDIPVIRNLILKYKKDGMMIIDPFANKNKIATVTNDLDSEYDTNYHMDALDFLKMFNDNSIDIVLFDPPYTPRQLMECYKKLNRSVTMSDTSQETWANYKQEINRIIKPGGYVLSFGWNSNGVSQNMSMEKIEILLVAHGGGKNDTICTVERKSMQGFLFNDKGAGRFT